jgi:hypothetical protein
MWGSQVRTCAQVPTLDRMVERIRRVAVQGISHPDDGSLLHAYIACLSFSDLCLAITTMFADPANVRLALRGRLLRLLREADIQQSDRRPSQDLVERSRAAGRENSAVRPRSFRPCSNIYRRPSSSR